MVRRYVSALVGVMAAFVLTFGSAGSALAGPGAPDPNEPKPDGYEFVGDGTPPAKIEKLTPEAQATLDEKQQLADEYTQVRAGKADEQAWLKRWVAFLDKAGDHKGARENEKRGSSSGTIADAAMTTQGTSKSLTVAQFPQERSYYCGPGSAKSILSYKNSTSHDGEALSQSLLGTAKYLETDAPNYQTAWCNGVNCANHPYPETLSYWLTGNWYNLYVAVGSPNLSTYQSNLMADINGYYPMAGNTVESGGGAHYNNHPFYSTIYHWVAIRGYDSNGGTTQIVDPAANSAAVNWANVQPYANINSGDMVSFMSTRGYVW